MLSAFANTLVRVLLAPECVSCRLLLRQPLSEPVCSSCLAAVRPISAPFCAQCGHPMAEMDPTPICARCRDAPRSFAMARSAGLYDGVLRELIHQFKYGGHRHLALSLAGLAKAAGAEVLTGAVALVPVPLAPWRQFSRG